MKNKFYLIAVLAVLVGVGIWAQFAFAQKVNPNAQAWDYKTVFVLTNLANNGQTWSEDGRDLPGPVRTITKSKELGAEGWELVVVVDDHNNGYSWTTFYFKRRK